MPNPSGAEIHDTARRALKNSLANIGTGISTSLMYLLVPPVLARTLTVSEFGAWAIITQMANYLSRLDLGIQGAIGRYVAFYSASHDGRAIDRFVNTALTILSAVAFVAALAVVVLSTNIKAAFPQIPVSLVHQSTVALRVIGFTMLVGLVSSVATGALVGIERNELVTYIVGPGRIVLAGLLILIALMRPGIIHLAIAFAAVNLVCYGLLWHTAQRKAYVRVRPFTFDSHAAREIREYCGSTTIWSAAMLMISGLDTLIVGRLDFSRVAAYAACVAPIVVLGGLQQAMFSPLLQVGAKFAAQGRSVELGDLLERSTRVSVVILLVCIVPLLAFSKQVLAIWLGPTYAGQAALILRLLLIGHAIRLAATPYALLLLATGNHRTVRLVPLIEGIVNVCVAVGLGLRYGASGVACGVVVGAVTAQVINYNYNLPRTHGDVIDRRRLLRSALINPTLCFVPVALTVLIPPQVLSVEIMAILRIASIAIGMALVWMLALRKTEREWVVALSRRLFP